MASKKLKEAAKFSEDAIEIAVGKMEPMERNKLLTGLSSLCSSLGEKQTKTNKGKKKVTDEDIFSNFILPRIQQKMLMIERQEPETLLTLSTEFVIETSYDSLSILELKDVHARILSQEESFKDATLLVQYFRGQLYLSLNRKIRRENKKWSQFITEEIKCSYSTVLRYMTLASFISSFPRLLLCNLTFAQILKHRIRITKHLENETGIQLRDQLAMSFDLSVNGTSIHIGCKALPMPPKQKNDFNPDWEYLNAKSIKAPDQKTEQWVEAVAECNTDHEGDGIDDMEEYLRLVLTFYGLNYINCIYAHLTGMTMMYSQITNTT